MAQTGSWIGNRFSAMDDVTGIEVTTGKPKGSCRARYLCLMSRRGPPGQCLIEPEWQVTAPILPLIVQGRVSNTGTHIILNG
jgi:hypothetical protein